MPDTLVAIARILDNYTHSAHCTPPRSTVQVGV